MKGILPNIIVPIVTPLLNKNIDDKSLAKLLRFQINNYIEAMFILGTTGEFNKMSLSSKKNLLDAFYRIINMENRSVFSVVGISAQNSAEMLEIINHCINKNYQVDAFVLAPLFGDGSCERKLELVLQSTTKDIMLYNNPSIHEGSNIPIELLKEVSKHPQVIGIKDSSGDQVYFNSLLSLSTPKFCIYKGDEKNLVDALKNPHVSGIVPGTANIIPLAFYNLVNNIEVTSSQENILKTKDQLAKFPNYIYGLKTWLNENGILDSVETF